MRADGRSPYGPAWVRLEVEVERQGVPFDGRDLRYGDYAYAGNASIELVTLVDQLSADSAYHWRARIGYDLAQAWPTTHSRWYLGGTATQASAVHTRTRLNRPIVANPDHLVVDASGIATMLKPGVLENDRDPEGDTLTVSRYTQGAYGRAVVDRDGAVVYVPDDPDFVEDHFTYTVADGLGREATALVTVTGPGNCDLAACLRGDYFVAVRTTSGALRSIHCWVAANGQSDCDRDPETRVLLLGDPVCQ